jgi:hypothetical protein
VTVPTVGTQIRIVPSLPAHTRREKVMLYGGVGLAALLAWVLIFYVTFGHRGHEASAGAWPNRLTAAQQAAVDKLPTGAMDATKRSAALAAFDKAIGVDVSADEGAQAAGTACGLLQAKQNPAELVHAAASGGALTPQMARAYLLGASTLYCPNLAPLFADPATARR